MASTGNQQRADRMKIWGVAGLTGSVIVLITLASTLYALSFTVSATLALVIGVTTAIVASQRENPTNVVSVGSYFAAAVFVFGGGLAVWTISPESASGWIADLLGLGRITVITLFVMLALIAGVVGFKFD